MEATSVLSKCTCGMNLNSNASNRSARGLTSTLAFGNNSSTRKQLKLKKNISGKRCTVMRWGGGQDKDSGEERPETLFMRELAKRKKLGQDVGMKETDTKTMEEEPEKKADTGSASSKPKFTDDQRKRSMALNSEGLEGLIPRGQELVKLGGTFWLSFWPLIAGTLVLFVASYLYFGPAFLHTGNRTSPPPYIDPYQLLDSEQLPSTVGPNRVPYNTYRSPQ